MHRGRKPPPPPGAPDLRGPALVEALRGGGFVLYFRHAATDFAQSDTNALNVGRAAGLSAGAALVDYGISRGDLALMGAVTASPSGLQAFLLARRGSGALWWAAVNPPAWALAWFLTTFVITKNVKERFAVFGASGALVFALLTWLVLTFLFRRNESEPLASLSIERAPARSWFGLPIAFNLLLLPARPLLRLSGHPS